VCTFIILASRLPESLLALYSSTCLARQGNYRSDNNDKEGWRMSWWKRREKVVVAEAQPSVCGFILLTAGTIKLMPETDPQQGTQEGVADAQQDQPNDKNSPV
jgi:hypothetical protein